MSENKMEWKDSFFWSAISFQALMLIFTGLWLDYGADASSDMTGGEAELTTYYPMFQDVHVMIFVGFGFLMTFLRKYGYSAVGYNFILSALALQWGIILQNFMRQLFKNPLDSKFFDRFQDIELNVVNLIEGDFAAGSMMISFGAVLGKTSLTQLVWMIFFEMFWYAANEQVLSHEYMVTDAGGSMVIHTFGAFFGLAVSYMITPRSMSASNQDEDNKPVYHSDLFSMIGTIFLWMYWPSFNAAVVMPPENTIHALKAAQHRAVINTLYSLCGSCVMAMCVSKLYRGKFEMVDLQNATLSGGVAMGAACPLAIGVWGALLVGMVTGTVSALGFAFISNFLWKRLGLHDTCGVFNLHAVPGVIGGLASAVACVTVDDLKYGTHVGDIFIGRADGRSAGRQGAYQVAGTATSMGLGILGGLLTGFLLNTRLFDKPKTLFTDATSWNVPEEEIPNYHAEHSRDVELRHRVGHDDRE